MISLCFTSRCFWRNHVDRGRLNVRHQGRGGTIHQDCAQIVEQFLGSILRRLKVEELRVLVNESCIYSGVQKLGMLQHVQKKRNVRL